MACLDDFAILGRQTDWLADNFSPGAWGDKSIIGGVVPIFVRWMTVPGVGYSKLLISLGLTNSMYYTTTLLLTWLRNLISWNGQFDNLMQPVWWFTNLHNHYELRTVAGSPIGPKLPDSKASSSLPAVFTLYIPHYMTTCHSLVPRPPLFFFWSLVCIKSA